MNRLGRVLSVVLTGSVAIALAGCGSDEGSASKQKSELDAASSAKLDTYLAVPALGLDRPLSKKPAAGKKIIGLECGVPACQEISSGIRQGSQTLGYEFSTINLGATPEENAKAFDQALDAKPDGIHMPGAGIDALEPQLERAKKEGVTVVVHGVGGEPEDPIVAKLEGDKTLEAQWEALALYIARDSEGTGKVAVFNTAAFPIMIGAEDHFNEVLKDVCAGCSATGVETQLTDIGTALPARVVSTLQSDPDIDYVLFAFGDMSLGVPAALAEAGMADKVKLIGTAPTVQNLQNVKEGVENAYAVVPLRLLGWSVVDSFARAFNGDDMAPVKDWVFPTQVVTKENLPQVEDYQAVPDFENVFKTMWQIS